jgi:type II secretory pathway pseudopilin PulG
MRKSFAFTLAEVLITLGIIGVVSALTLPTLIKKYQEKVWVTSYLKLYSTLESAYASARNENGPAENWDGMGAVYENGRFKMVTYDKDTVYNTFKPYLKVSEQYLTNNGPWNRSINCMPDTCYYLNGEIAKSCPNHIVPAIQLQSGACIVFGGGSSQHSFFWIDTNSKKGPNTMGKDQFVFGLGQNRLAPHSWSDSPDECNMYDKSSRAGLTCGAWIIRYKNMDYLHLTFDEIKENWGRITYYW